MSDYAVKVTISNGRIRAAMANAGFKNVSQMCKQANLNQSAIGDLLNLKTSPLDHNGKWRKIVLHLADVLAVLPDDLFSATQRTMRITQNHTTKFVPEAQMQRIAADAINMDRLEHLQDNAALEELEEEDRVSFCESVMKEFLRPREMLVIQNRYMENKTFEEIAEKLNVSHHRVRQIEDNALRKLRVHGTKLKELL